MADRKSLHYKKLHYTTNKSDLGIYNDFSYHKDLEPEMTLDGILEIYTGLSTCKL